VPFRESFRASFVTGQALAAQSRNVRLKTKKHRLDLCGGPRYAGPQAVAAASIAAVHF